MRRFQNLLYITRGTEDETDSLKQVLSLARNNTAEFENDLRHAPWVKLPDEEINESVNAAERDHRAAPEALIKKSGITRRARVHHVRSRADHSIARLVDEMEIDILVMGTVARTGIPGFVIGNTAENVQRELRCSLLALKPNGFVSPVRAY